MALLKHSELDSVHFLRKRTKSALCVFPVSNAGLFRLAMLQMTPKGWSIQSQISLREADIDELYDFSFEGEEESD